MRHIITSLEFDGFEARTVWASDSGRESKLTGTTFEGAKSLWSVVTKKGLQFRVYDGNASQAANDNNRPAYQAFDTFEEALAAYNER